MERKRIKGRPKFFQYPLLSQECVKLRTSNLADIYSQHTCEQKTFENLGEKGALAYPGTSQFFKYPILSQECVKLRTSNLTSIFRGSMRTNIL